MSWISRRKLPVTDIAFTPVCWKVSPWTSIYVLVRNSKRINMLQSGVSGIMRVMLELCLTKPAAYSEEAT